jgi:hypothetical protein
LLSRGFAFVHCRDPEIPSTVAATVVPPISVETKPMEWQMVP